jgi:hypothetical protein
MTSGTTSSRSQNGKGRIRALIQIVRLGHLRLGATSPETYFVVTTGLRKRSARLLASAAVCLQAVPRVAAGLMNKTRACGIPRRRITTTRQAESLIGRPPAAMRFIQKRMKSKRPGNDLHDTPKDIQPPADDRAVSALRGGLDGSRS